MTNKHWLEEADSEGFITHLLEMQVWSRFREVFPTGIKKDREQFDLCEVEGINYYVEVELHGMNISFTVIEETMFSEPREEKVPFEVLHEFTR